MVPVTSVEEAIRAEVDYRARSAAARVVGFDFGNSPAEVEASELPWGARIVLSATNGTRVIQAARGASTLLASGFVKTYAVAYELADSMYGTTGSGDRLRIGGT